MKQGYMCPMCDLVITEESPFMTSYKMKLHIDFHCDEFAERLKALA